MRRLTVLAAALPGLLAATLAAAPAGAAPNTSHRDMVNLIVSVDGDPIFSEGDLLYDIAIENTGPDTATGIELRAVTRICEDDNTTIDRCSEQGREFFYPSDLAPGQLVSFPYRQTLDEDGAQNVRTTFRITKVDQFNRGDRGGCQTFRDEDDSCVSIKTVLPY